MKRTMMVILLASLMTGFAGLALAHPATPRVDRREARQHARVYQGMRSGALTRGEAARLRVGQRHIHRMERRAKADGFVSARERARLARAQNRESRAIWRLKHNPRVRCL
jgi:hypothetical protein